jgi:hypothetical protein
MGNDGATEELAPVETHQLRGICPHCGRLRKKSALPLEFAAGFGLAVLCMLSLTWRSDGQDHPPSAVVTPSSPHETVIARPYRHLERSLTASVSYNRTLHVFRVENRDAFTWTDCQVSLNSHGISGYDLTVKSIKPGLTDALLLHSAEFIDPDGEKFDPATASVATLDLDCESPQGRLYYGGKFGADDARSVGNPRGTDHSSG